MPEKQRQDCSDQTDYNDVRAYNDFLADENLAGGTQLVQRTLEFLSCLNASKLLIKSREPFEGVKIISELYRRDLLNDYKLQTSNFKTFVKHTPRQEFPFNRHTVTIGIGNKVVDFQTAKSEHEQIKERQKKFADEIEKVKEEMEKVRLLEQEWYDDYLRETYINDVTSATFSEPGTRQVVSLTDQRDTISSSFQELVLKMEASQQSKEIQKIFSGEKLDKNWLEVYVKPDLYAKITENDSLCTVKSKTNLDSRKTTQFKERQVEALADIKV